MLRRAMLLVVAALAMSGCSTSGGSSAAPGEVVTPGPAVPLPAARCDEVPNPTATVCATVTIRGFAFDPPVVTIPSWARVVFVNEDGAPHSIAWADGTPTSPRLERGDSTERSFRDQASGAIEYTCGIHGARMSGRLVADASQPVP